MSKPFGSKNLKNYPREKHKNFYWQIVSEEYSKELSAFKRAHDRVRDGKSPSIEWERKLEGFLSFLKEIGKIPTDLLKPSLGRIDHSKGYETGNIMWKEHAINSVKRKGTKFQFEKGRVSLRQLKFKKGN